MNRFPEIRNWAEERNLIKGSNPQAQMLKTMEELGEVAAGVARDNQSAIIDGIGDVVVCLTILAAQRDIPIEACIEYAWDQIKDRKGRMVDGVFIKSGD